VSVLDIPIWLVVVLVSLPPVIAVWVLVWSLCCAARIGDEALELERDERKAAADLYPSMKKATRAACDSRAA